MKLTDLLPSEKWQKLADAIYEQTGLSANIFDTEGVRILPLVKPNRLCPAIKATNAGQSSICAVAHMNMANIAMRNRESVIEKCDAGFIKLVTPIFAGDEFVGAVGACGLFMDDGEVDAFLINKITGIPEEEVMSLSEGIASLTGERMEELKQYVEKQIESMLSER
ncbi:MAG: PocR ligand-binding domain-containing protein [Desulfococcaceae bacterium]